MALTLVAAALAPVLFMLHFVYVRDKYEREPLRRILFVYILSFFTVIPAAIFESILMFNQTASLLLIAVDAWLVIALSEELVKYLALSWLAFRHGDFNEIYDGILYGVAASLGFATIENLLYVMMSGGDALFVALLRALLSVPAHALWGVMLGYYIGTAKFAATRHERRRLILQGLCIAIFWHGLYDFFAYGSASAPALALPFTAALFGILLVNWIIGIRYIRLAQQKSHFRRPAPIVNPIAAFSRTAKFCHQCGAPQPLENKHCQRCGYVFPE